MYINDINILYYVLIGITGAIVGGFVDYCNKMFLKEEKILSKKNLKEYTKISKPNYILMIITTIAYIALLYKFGSKDLIKFSMYTFLIPMLLSAFVVDCKEQIIPNRLNLTMFENCVERVQVLNLEHELKKWVYNVNNDSVEYTR